MTHVMCSPWKITFTLAPLTPLTVFSPIYRIFGFQWTLMSLFSELECKFGEK
jgi:hypothetical protein